MICHVKCKKYNIKLIKLSLDIFTLTEHKQAYIRQKNEHTKKWPHHLQGNFLARKFSVRQQFSHFKSLYSSLLKVQIHLS